MYLLLDHIKGKNYLLYKIEEEKKKRKKKKRVLYNNFKYCFNNLYYDCKHLIR